MLSSSVYCISDSLSLWGWGDSWQCVWYVRAEHPESSHRCPLPTEPSACFHRSVSEHQLPEAPCPHNWRESSHLLKSERFSAPLHLPLWLFFFCSDRVSSFCSHWDCQQDVDMGSNWDHLRCFQPPKLLEKEKKLIMDCGTGVQKADEDGHLGFAFLLGLTRTTASLPTALRTGLLGPRRCTMIITAWVLIHNRFFSPLGVILKIMWTFFFFFRSNRQQQMCINTVFFHFLLGVCVGVIAQSEWQYLYPLWCLYANVLNCIITMATKLSQHIILCTYSDCWRNGFPRSLVSTNLPCHKSPFDTLKALQGGKKRNKENVWGSEHCSLYEHGLKHNFPLRGQWT